MEEQLKLAPKENQPVRKHRTVFTSTKGLFRKQKWVVLDIDEYGITYRSNQDIKEKCFLQCTSFYRKLKLMNVLSH